MTDQTNSIGLPMDQDELEDPGTNDNSPDPLIGETPKSGALSAIGSKNDQQSRVSEGRQAMSDLRTQFAGASGQASDAYAQQRKTLQDATQRLLSMQYGPTPQEAAYRVAAAWGTGEPGTGRINSGGINAAHADVLKEQRQGELTKQQLITQYGMQVPQAQLGAANSNMSRIIQEMRIQQSDNNNASIQVDRQVKPIGKYFLPNPTDPNGAPVFNKEMYDADVGAARDKAKNAAAIKAATAQAVAGNMDQPTLQLLGTQFRLNGVMPSLGQNAGPAKIAIAKEAARQAQEAGDTPGIVVANQAVRKALTAELTNNSKQYGMFHSFEGTMVDMAKQAQALSAQVDRTNSPLLNSLLQAGDSALSGPSPLAQFDQKNYTLAMEHAKIMSGSMGNTPVAEGMAKDTMKKLRIAFGKGTYNDLVNQLITDAQTRNRNMIGTISDITQQLGGKPTVQPAQPVARPGQGSIDPLVSQYLPGGAKYKGP